MSKLKEQIKKYLPELMKRKKDEKDKDKKWYLKIKIDELRKLRDQL